jgi:hypothetical protein
MKKENQQWFVIGHGLGGLAVLDLLNREAGYFENKIDGLILSNFIFELEEKLIFSLFSSSFPKISERLRISKVFLGNSLTNDENEALLFEQDPLIVHRPTWGVVQAIKKQSLNVYRGAYFLNWPILLLQSGADKFLLNKGIEYFVMGVKKNLLTEKSYSNLKHDLYNEKDKNKIIKDPTKSWKEKRIEFRRLKPKCITCKRPVGTRFTRTHDSKEMATILKAVCGSLSDPCDLHIELKSTQCGLYPDIVQQLEKEKKLLVKQLEKEKKLALALEKKNTLILCDAILKRGINKGLPCCKKAFENNKCKIHINFIGT